MTDSNRLEAVISMPSGVFKPYAGVSTGVLVFTKTGHGSFGGLVIGLTLPLVHILGIGLTGTSRDPARSFGPALAAAFTGNTAPIAALWGFIVGPLVGGALAAVVYKALRKEDRAFPSICCSGRKSGKQSQSEQEPGRKTRLFFIRWEKQGRGTIYGGGIEKLRGNR